MPSPMAYGVGRLRPFLVVLGVVAAITLTLGLGTEFHIEEREYREEIRSGDQVSVISGIQRELVQEQGWAPGWLYALSLGLAVPFGGSWLLLALPLCHPRSRRLGGQAPLPLEEQPRYAPGHWRRLDPHHPGDGSAPAGRFRQPVGERLP